MNDANEKITLRFPCQNMRSKEMYYEAADDDEFASGIFWCVKTHENFGPDGEPVSKKHCCEGRQCFIR